MKIKKGDAVQMLAGKDHGKTGKILEMRMKTGRVVVEGLNLVTKHQKPKASGQKGQKIQKPAAVNISNVKLVCPQCGKATRVGYAVSKESKLRQCKVCKATFN